MTTVRPHIAPQQPPPPPPPSLKPVAALPWSPPCTRCRTADAHGRKEGVAESCCPTEVADTAIDGDVEGGSDDDGCGSCVDGSEGSAGQDDEEARSDNVVWWSQQSSSSNRCFAWATNAGRTTATNRCDECDDDGDPKAAAARRQEEDRKFWEECLASGYP